MTSGKILLIADHMVDRIKNRGFSLNTIKNLFSYFADQYQVSQSEVWSAYFAAVNILKNEGVELTKRRKPLTSLTKKERSVMRGYAKQFAVLMGNVLGCPVELTRMPIREHSEYGFFVQIAIMPNAWATHYFYPTQDQLAAWSALNDADRITSVYRFAQQFKNGRGISEIGIEGSTGFDIESVRADLERLMS